MSAQKLFFSYSRTDSAFALKLAKDLRDAGADIWIDQLDIPAGNHWDSAVEKALNNAAYVLVILTPASTASTNVMDEVSFALESGKKVIPVLLEDCLAPFRLRRLQRIDFTTDYNSGFSQLVQSLSLVIPDVALKLDNETSRPAQPVKQPAGMDAQSNETKKKENQLWEDACRVNTIAAYKKYLKDSITGENAAEAKLLIKQLELEQTEDELEALLWQKAKNENTKNLYQHYLQEYPQGNYKTLALAAISDLEKEEKEEQRRIKELEKQQERERAQLEKEAKEKALKEKQEKEKALQLEREKAQQLAKEKAQKEKEERERVMQIEREKALKEKQEKDKIRQEEKEKALKDKQEKDRIKQEEKEKALKEKQEKDKLRQQELQKAKLEKQQNPDQPQPTSGAQKRYAMIGGGILLVALGIWGIISLSSGGKQDDDLTAWNSAQSTNDSVAYASYLQQFPSGKYFTLAKTKSDSITTRRQQVRDSLRAVADAAIVAQNTQTQSSATETDPKSSTTSTAPKKEEPKKPTPPSPKPKPTTPDKPAAKFTLGQSHQGGVVIYINPTGEHGLIAATKDEGYLNWAAGQRKCASYKVEGFTEWRLPTKEELNILYRNRKHLGEFANGIYWSSTAEDKDLAWAQNFINGNQATVSKNSTNVVRAVHSF